MFSIRGILTLVQSVWGKSRLNIIQFFNEFVGIFFAVPIFIGFRFAVCRSGRRYECFFYDSIGPGAL